MLMEKSLSYPHAQRMFFTNILMDQIFYDQLYSFRKPENLSRVIEIVFQENCHVNIFFLYLPDIDLQIKDLDIISQNFQLLKGEKPLKSYRSEQPAPLRVRIRPSKKSCRSSPVLSCVTSPFDQNR